MEFTLNCVPIATGPRLFMEQRKIIHIDRDCYYAAVEMRERPELVGRPIAVGGGSRRGVVTTSNYEALGHARFLGTTTLP